DAICGLVPDVELPAGVTVAHLLRHAGGLRDYGVLPRYHADVRARPGRPWTRAEFLDSVLTRGALFPAGQGWAYSNVGYMLLIDAIERVTNAPFARAIERYITQPQQLTQTKTLERLEDLASCEPGFGSEVTPDGSTIDVRGIYHPGWCAPRLVASSVSDVTTVFDGLFPGALLAPASLEQMLTLVPLDATSSIGAGTGIYGDPSSPFGRAYHHGGGGPGYDISVSSYLDLAVGRVTAAVIVNTSTRPGAA